jgi:hypothetical protein
MGKFHKMYITITMRRFSLAIISVSIISVALGISRIA